MLLEFRVSHYKSFVDEMVFSMMPAPKQKGLDYSILSESIDNKLLKGLCSAVVYGPNASGKTNLIGAMDVLKAIVRRGHIRNADEKHVQNPAQDTLELIPNANAAYAGDLAFSISFTAEKMLIRYDLTVDLGAFLDDAYSRKVVLEALYINDERLFIRRGNADNRNDALKFGKFEKIAALLINNFFATQEIAEKIASQNLIDDELFLTNGFKNMFSNKLVGVITEWFQKKLTVILRADAIRAVQLTHTQAQSLDNEKALSEAAHRFGSTANAFKYIASKDEPMPVLYALLEQAPHHEMKAIDADQFESYGTIRFINMFPFLLQALRHGQTLVIDEFDASIHPMALMSLINVFHNDAINLHHAQLIFNTHNPIFLNKNLFRRDEIKFVERDDDTHCSTQYALSDFSTTGKNGVRKNEDYLHNYFISKYGAIKDVDFAPLFEELLRQSSEVQP
ncbi:MAG: ATP-binding protein [Clostridia bacterium]